MSMHNIPLTDLERLGLINHHLPIDKPSQLSDCFRAGIAWALQTNVHKSFYTAYTDTSNLYLRDEFINPTECAGAYLDKYGLSIMSDILVVADDGEITTFEIIETLNVKEK